MFKIHPFLLLFFKFIFFLIVGFYILAVPIELILIPQWTDTLKPFEGIMCITISFISFAYSSKLYIKLIKTIWSKTENAKKK